MKKAGWLRYVGDCTTQLRGIIINQCKDLCWTSSEMESTPLKMNMSPENQWLEDVFPTEIVPF